jgi:hypothetical protein
VPPRALGLDHAARVTLLSDLKMLTGDLERRSPDFFVAVPGDRGSMAVSWRDIREAPASPQQVRKVPAFPENDCDNDEEQNEDEGEEARVADEYRRHLQHREPQAEVLELDAEQHGRRGLQEERDAAGGEELVDRRRPEQRGNDERVQEHAESKSDRAGAEQPQRA